MSWRLARSLEALRGELDQLAPRRSKVSDGSIGDAAHASRDSDHNPWVKDRSGVGVVRAIDVTHDPKGGMDCQLLAEHLAERLGKHSALGSGAYVIFRSRIISTDRLKEGWRSYSGSNPHDKHLHVSVGVNSYDSPEAWGLGLRQFVISHASLQFSDPRGQVAADLRAALSREPHVLTVTEVAERRDLLRAAAGRAEYRLIQPADSSGSRCSVAILARDDLKFLSATWVPVVPATRRAPRLGGHRERGFIRATFESAGDRITVITGHWVTRRPTPGRAAARDRMTAKAAELAARFAQEDHLAFVTGDFNDRDWSDLRKRGLRVSGHGLDVIASVKADLRVSAPQLIHVARPGFSDHRTISQAYQIEPRKVKP